MFVDRFYFIKKINVRDDRALSVGDAPKRNKKWKKGGNCSGKLIFFVDTHTLSVVGHTCPKTFSNFSTIVQQNIFSFLKNQLSNSVDPMIARQSISSLIMASELTKLIPPTSNALTKLIQNTERNIRKSIAAGDLSRGKDLLKNRPEIEDAVITINTTPSPHIGRHSLVWSFKEGCTTIREYLRRDLPLTLSLDTTHDAVDKTRIDESYLLTIQLKNVDFGKFQVFFQALISGEDNCSISNVLSWFEANIIQLRSYNRKLVLMDDSRAEFSAVSSVWPNTPIFLCTWHVLQNLTRHLSPASLSIAKNENSRTSTLDTHPDKQQ